MGQQQQQQLLKKREELSIAQILCVHGKQFIQIKKKYSDELDGRCAVGVIMSYFGWVGSTIEYMFTIDVYESELPHVNYFGNQFSRLILLQFRM